MEKYLVSIHGKDIELERLSNGKFKKPEIVRQLSGSYGGSQTKPAVEVIIVCMKPLSEKTYVDQALNNQKGITWLDDCRIPYQNEGDIAGWNKDSFEGETSAGFLEGLNNQSSPKNPQGRFPANLLVSDDVLNDGKSYAGGYNPSQAMSIYGNEMKERKQVKRMCDSGSYSRYFDLDKWAEKTLPFLIVPKASKSEKGTDNIHPTVKPIKLMSYLITMGSRQGDIILDPFSGSGTTCIAAKTLGRNYIGIELSEEYANIARKRLEAVTQITLT